MSMGIELLLLFALALAAALVLVIWAVESDSKKARFRHRIAQMTPELSGKHKISGLARFILAARRQMARPEFLGGCVGGVVGIVAAAFVGLSLPLSILTVVACVAALWFVVRTVRLRRLRKHFADRFPDAVDHLTRAVQAGVPMEKALVAVGENFEGEIGRRFTLLVQQLELGVSFRTALDIFAGNLKMPDVNFFCSVLALNRETGSRITPMLISLSRTLRERRAVARKLLVLTSETRSAAKVLSILPFFVLGLQFLLNPRNFDFLVSDETGKTILFVCLSSMLIGIFIINRMSNMRGGK